MARLPHPERPRILRHIIPSSSGGNKSTRQRHTTLNEAFREWLHQFTASSGDARQFDELMSSLGPFRAGRRFTRDEMNER